MSSRRDGMPGQLTLLPVHGNLDKKPRPLDRDVSTLGRARGSDLRLDAAEISTLHCIIYRTPEGYRVRDAGSRTGTRINGQPARNSILHDGDVLQLGPFSFEVRVPVALFGDAPALDPLRVQHWQASRRRLAAIALRLRRRLHEQKSRPASAAEVELQHKVQQLRERLRGYDQRANQLEQAERELEQERQALHREREAQRDRIQRIEADMAARLEQTEEEIRQRWVEFQQRCHVNETQVLERVDRLAAVPVPAEITAKVQELESRTKELAAQEDQVRRQQQEFALMMQQHDHARADLDKQRAALAQQEASLKVQRGEVVRMLTELKKVQEELRRQQKVDVQAVLQENQELRQMLAEVEERLASAGSAAQEGSGRALDEARAENELLRQLLADKEQVIEQLAQRPAAEPALPDREVLEELRRMRSENDLLRQLLDEKQQLLIEATEQPAQAPAAPKSANELESYEAELNQFRAQLEADRQKLQEEWEQIRQRQDETDDATRDLEMQMSRERAELARERIKLDRMREELRADVERMQREMSVRDTLAPVQKLREEMQRRPGTRTTS